MTRVPGYRWVVLVLALILSSGTACTSGGDDRERSRPPITRPLDASDYADRDRICDLLPPKDAAELGYPSPGGESDGEITEQGKNYVVFACSRYPSAAPFLNYELFANFDILEDSYDTHEDTRDPGNEETAYRADNDFGAAGARY